MNKYGKGKAIVNRRVRFSMNTSVVISTRTKAPYRGVSKAPLFCKSSVDFDFETDLCETVTFTI